MVGFGISAFVLTYVCQLTAVEDFGYIPLLPLFFTGFGVFTVFPFLELFGVVSLFQRFSGHVAFMAGVVTFPIFAILVVPVIAYIILMAIIKAIFN